MIGTFFTDLPRKWHSGPWLLYAMKLILQEKLREIGRRQPFATSAVRMFLPYIIFSRIRWLKLVSTSTVPLVPDTSAVITPTSIPRPVFEWWQYRYGWLIHVILNFYRVFVQLGSHPLMVNATGITFTSVGDVTRASIPLTTIGTVYSTHNAKPMLPFRISLLRYIIPTSTYTWERTEAMKRD